MYKGSSQTCYKLELRNRILKAAMTEFLHKGVKSVKMDDIANTLAISKRTLYEIYWLRCGSPWIAHQTC